QTPPDFSGVYLSNPHRASTSSADRKHFDANLVYETLADGFPVVLTVTQTANDIQVTEIQSGAKSTKQFTFRGEESEKKGNPPAFRARLSKRELRADYSTEKRTYLGGSMTVPIQERWNLSPDGSTLTISSSWDGTHTFARQVTLESALANV